MYHHQYILSLIIQAQFMAVLIANIVNIKLHHRDPKVCFRSILQVLAHVPRFGPTAINITQMQVRS